MSPLFHQISHPATGTEFSFKHLKRHVLVSTTTYFNFGKIKFCNWSTHSRHLHIETMLQDKKSRPQKCEWSDKTSGNRKIGHFAAAYGRYNSVTIPQQQNTIRHENNHPAEHNWNSQNPTEFDKTQKENAPSL